MVQSFSMPALIDIKLTIAIIAAAMTLLFAILYATDFKNRKKKNRSIARASTAFYFMLVGIAAVVGLTFFGQTYNDNVFSQTVSKDYNVQVLTVNTNYAVTVIVKESILECTSGSDDGKTYAVLCHTSNGSFLPLDEIVRNEKSS